jgi:hypothetical protein
MRFTRVVAASFQLAVPPGKLRLAATPLLPTCNSFDLGNYFAVLQAICSFPLHLRASLGKVSIASPSASMSI